MNVIVSYGQIQLAERKIHSPLVNTVKKNMYRNQQDAQSFVIRLYFQYTLYLFLTVSVHLQEQPFISCMSYLVYADTT